ncbi:MAG: hypothetical protein FGM24_02835 [Candidatus Kapabacteria bacterium]|nr:hypothetical protein [Candidatus Kapabacteria bacterium]
MFLLTAFIGAAAQASAQQSLSVRGLVDQCYAVRFVDQAWPYDSLATDRPLPDSVGKATLFAMQGAWIPELGDTSSIDIDPDIGRLIDVDFTSLSDSLYLIRSDSDVDVDTALIYQLVVPIAADTIVVDSVTTARPWDGASGGVLSLWARDLLIVNDTIRVRGLGFRGGARSANGGECNMTEACGPLTSVFSAGKGESVYLASADCAAGYLPLVTGGGGGNSHNSGGGGGGNGGGGGRGGDQFVCSGEPGAHGLPGRPILAGSTGRVFFGGGGGGGHQNNNAASGGGPGGGVILLRAPIMLADSAVLDAAGSDVTARAGNDGGGGGGAGGTVVMDVCRLISPVDVMVRGGRGGNCDDSHGPGGGGGGGTVLLHPGIAQSASALCRVDAEGGNVGLVHSGSTSRGAMKGTDGVTLVSCTVVPLHSVIIDSAAAIGDTLRIRLSARDTLSMCDILVSHDISISGGAVSPIVDSSTADVLVADRRIRWNERQLTVQLLSRQSTEIKLLGVVSRDTTSLIGVRSSLAGVDERCPGDESSQRINVSACARALRPITRGLPFEVSITDVATTLVRYRIQAYTTAEVRIRAINMHGQVVAETTVENLPMLGPGEFIAEGTLDMSLAAQGMYFLVAASGLGSRAVPFMWTP